MADFRISAAAQADIIELLARTHERFGELARSGYEHLLVTALGDLAVDPDRIGTVKRPELGEGVRSYHLRHSRDRARYENGIVRRPRHLLLFRLARPDLIGIGRVLYDAMELERHLPSGYGDE
ncbi:type II toxin-antitoxin system RelE/ParE family toxin [Rhizobium sp. KDH_Rht_773_N]|jgi:toxin ParE1/3/4